MKKGTIFADWWIQCGRCEYMEALATHDRKQASEERYKRGWKRRYSLGYVCPDCAQEMADEGAKRIAARQQRGTSHERTSND